MSVSRDGEKHDNDGALSPNVAYVIRLHTLSITCEYIHVEISKNNTTISRDEKGGSVILRCVIKMYALYKKTLLSYLLIRSSNSVSVIKEGKDLLHWNFYILGISAENSGASDAVNVGDLPSLAMRNAWCTDTVSSSF